MMLAKSAIIVLLGSYVCSGQNYDGDFDDQPAVASARKTPDVSILNQIHRHNEDGSYTYGFEGSDGSFKIETKTKTGEVSGKYGYVDVDTGKLRVVEYGASKHGFEPSGEGITVPAPTLVESRPDQEDGEPEEVQPPRPAKRPASAKQQLKPAHRALPAVANPEPRSDGGWAVATAQLPEASRRPAAGGARPSPPASGNFREVAPEVPEAPTGWYQSTQQFGDGPWAAERPKATAAVQSYRTYEDEPEEPSPAELVHRQAAAVPSRPAGRKGGAGTPRALGAANYRTAPRQARPSGVFDQLVEQYALPESGSPVSHSNSFGL